MRKEYKYLVHIDLLEDLRKALQPYLVLDNFSEQRHKLEYTVRSIYYDTKDLSFYYEKQEGLKVRKKLRIRGYNELLGEKVVFLEIKRKYENFNWKNRSPVLYGDLEELFSTGNIEELVLSNKHSDKATLDGKRFFYHVFRKSLIPTVLVVYNREAYFGKFDRSIRITFDKFLRYQTFPELSDLYSNDKLRFAIPNYFLLELKFDLGFPLWLQQIVSGFKLNRIAFSKYSTCIDSDRKTFSLITENKFAFIKSPFKFKPSYKY